MFFSAYSGAGAGVPAWRATVMAHAADIGCAPAFVAHPTGGPHVVWCAWLSRHAVRVGDYVRMTATRCLVAPFDPLTADELESVPARQGSGSAGAWRSGRVRLTFSMDDRSVAATLPVAHPQQMYWTHTPHGTVIADDLRLCARFSNGSVDSRAALALLQFGTVPPPLTLFRDVNRMPNGHVSTIGPERVVTRTPCVPDVDVTPPADSKAWVLESLDSTLAAVEAPAVLFFSGGVDSGLLASRLVRMGRRDVTLAAYSFSRSCPETRLAMDMAAHLGLSCFVVDHDPRALTGMLGRVGDDYTFPFGDMSTVPMNVLVHSVRAGARPGTTVIEGTGADGEFGLAARYPVWARAYATPAAVRRRVRTLFRVLGLWRRDDDLTRLAGFLSRSASLPIELSALAQNPLEGIAFTTPPDVARTLVECTLGQFLPLLPQRRPATSVSLLDVILICAGAMAPKSFDPLRSEGLRPVYPFLNPSLAYGTLSLPPSVTCARGVAKAILKEALAEEVPAEWVYRPKSGFTPPYVAICAAAPFQDMLRDVALSSRNPLLDVCNARVVRRMADCTRRGDPVAPGVHDFLWSLTFGSAWLAWTQRTAYGSHAC